MESFWEKITDALILGIKVFVAFFFIRVLIMIFGYEIEVPYLDPLLMTIFDWISRLFPNLLP